MQDEIRLLGSYHLSWWFSSPSAFFVELPTVLGASGFSWSEVIFDRSTTIKHVGFDMLLKTATTNFVSWSGGGRLHVVDFGRRL